MDVAVPATVLIQIQFLQGVVALELTDDAVGLEGDLQLAADLVPAIDILPPQPGDLHDLPEAFRRQDVDDVACPRQDPGDQYVGVGVVPQAARSEEHTSELQSLMRLS